MKHTFILTIVFALLFALGVANKSEARCRGGWGCHRGYVGYRYIPPPPPPPPMYYYGAPRFHRHFHRPYGYGYRRW